MLTNVFLQILHMKDTRSLHHSKCWNKNLIGFLNMKTAFLEGTNVAQCVPADIALERFEISLLLQLLEQKPDRISNAYSYFPFAK